MRHAFAIAVACAALVSSTNARADETPRAPHRSVATFSLIIGSNRSVDSERASLKYADDDAARYFDMFRLLGARTYLLSRLDENTRALHPQAAAEATLPTRASFDHAVADLANDVAQAAARDVDTIVYITYAGHGDVKNGQGYVALEDARVTGGELASVVARIPATNVHVIVDACASYFLANSRGPGGERRTLEGFRATSLADDPRVGLLLSTSSSRESHEWEGFESGVFSHEVRSGLYGAADADADGEISYREIAAFVRRANAAIPAEKYRPDLFARPPRNGATLVDIRSALKRHVTIDGAHAGHYYLEDGRGVRIADVHNAAGQAISLLRPGPSTPLYLHRAEDAYEYRLPASPDVLVLADLATEPIRIQPRGAAQDSFATVFSLPFTRDTVELYGDERATTTQLPEQPPHASTWRAPAGTILVGVSAAGLATGGIALAGAYTQAHGSFAAEPEKDAAARNARVSTLNVVSGVSFATAGVAGASALLVLLWPHAPNVQVSADAHGTRATWEGTF